MAVCVPSLADVLHVKRRTNTNHLPIKPAKRKKLIAINGDVITGVVAEKMFGSVMTAERCCNHDDLHISSR